MDSLRDAMYAEASGIPPLGDIDRAIHDVSAARRRWAGVVGATAAALVLLVALVGPPWQPVTMEPVQPQPYPTTALEGGAVIAWGSNENGQTEVPVAAQTGVTAIAVGAFRSLALKDGRVIAWGGRNGEGEVDVPAEVESGVTAIASGGGHGLALKDGRVIDLWHAGGLTPAGLDPVPAAAQSGVTAIAAGWHGMALKDGRVIVWAGFPAPVEAQSGVTAIAAGESLSMALKDGRVITWDSGNDPDFQASDVPIEAQSGVTAIAAGPHHGLALKDGRVIAWGRNSDGQITVPVEAQSGVTAIAAGEDHSLALKDGRVIAWGNSASGATKVPVEAQSGVTAIAASGSVSMAIRGPSDSGHQSTSTEAAKTPPPGTDTSADESTFAAAIEAAGVLNKPSAEDAALASDPSRYQWDNGSPQVSAAGNFAALRACGPDEVTLASVGNPPPCTTGWAYQTGSVDSGEVHRGMLGAAAEPALFELDDRFFVAIESAPGWPRPPTAWLIDSASGGHSELTWRDEPTTVSSSAQALVLSDGPWSVPRMVRRQALSDFYPEVFLPRVVDGRDRTIRPLAVPENASADAPVTHDGEARIWIGTTTDGHLGLAHSDDGGGAWNEVALPAQSDASAEELEAAAAYGDLVVSIATDDDRIAVTDAWSYDHERYVYVSDDAGLSWSTVTVPNPSGNGAHLYVLADGRLLMVRSEDPYVTQLLVSTDSDWTTLAGDPQATRATTNMYVDVNRAGTVSMYYPLEVFDRGTIGGMPDAPPIRHHFSTDLVTWRTIAEIDD